MEIHVVAIQFSRIANGPAVQALRLRKNAIEVYPFPEWQRGVTTTAESCPVAYVMEDLRLNPLPVVIMVKFWITGINNFPFVLRVRAVGPDVQTHGPLWQIMLNTHINVSGEVKEREVDIAEPGETDWLPFELKNLNLVQSGVGIYQVIWKWQFLVDSLGVWKDFDVTRHQVYNLLKKPTAPWAQESAGDMQLPWTDVLNYSCIWAGKSFSDHEAAARITAMIFSMGPLWFEYNCISFLPAFVQVVGYTGQSYFGCMEFLQHLKTRNVNRFIICTDCAVIVSTFSNILGCDLWQSTMQTPGTTFRTNRILPIGTSSWQKPCGLQGFSYHEVAWAGNGTDNDPVFDACLAVDGTVNPQDGFSLPLLPVNIRLGAEGSGLYRDKLVFQQDWRLAEPQPATRQRRLPFPSLSPIRLARQAGTIKKQEDEKLTRTKSQLKFSTWKNQNLLPQTLLIHGFFLDPRDFPEWDIQIFDELPRSAEGPAYIHTIWRSRYFIDEALRIDFYECSSRLKAQEFLLRLLTNIHTTIDVMRPLPGLGDIAFSSSAKRNVVFTRANMVMIVSKTGISTIPPIDLASDIDRKLYEKPGATQPRKLAFPKQTGKAKKKEEPVRLSDIYPLSENDKMAAQRFSNTSARRFLKIFSNAKDLVLEEDHLSFGDTNARQDIDVYAVNSQG